MTLNRISKLRTIGYKTNVTQSYSFRLASRLVEFNLNNGAEVIEEKV